MKCINCKSDNVDGAKFCVSSGPALATPLASGMKRAHEVEFKVCGDDLLFSRLADRIVAASRSGGRYAKYGRIVWRPYFTALLLFRFSPI